jgi:hypothetical protein
VLLDVFLDAAIEVSTALGVKPFTDRNAMRARLVVGESVIEYESL